MGYIRHHAIVVTSWNEEAIRAAHLKAEQLGMTATPIAGPVVNGYQSFLVAPDGSKEGWQESQEGNEKREMFKRYLRTQEYEDGSSSLAWVEVFYGDDDEQVGVVDDGDAKRRSFTGDQSNGD